MKMVIGEAASSVECSATGTGSCHSNSGQSDRAPDAAKTSCCGERRVALLGVVLALPLALLSCGKKNPTVVEYEISQTTVYRGVFVRAHGQLSPGTQGTLTLSRVEVWVAGQRWPREVGSETIDTIDSVTVELAWEGLRTTFPGRFDRSTGALIVSGNPWLNCTMTNGRFEGDDFVAIPPATRTIRALCGSWSGSRPSGDDRGRLSILIDGAEIVGRAIDDVDGTVEPVEGSSDAVGEVVMTFPGYTLTGTAVQQSLVGSYQSTLDGGRSGNWGAAPCPF